MTDVAAACDRARQALAPGLAGATTLIGDIVALVEQANAAAADLTTARLTGSVADMRGRLQQIDLCFCAARLAADQAERFLAPLDHGGRQ